MRIAVLAHRLDGLFIEESDSEVELHYLVPKDHSWLQSVLKGKKIILFQTDKVLPLEDISDDDIIRRSNITTLLKRNRIPNFLTSHRGSRFLQKWSKENGITLMGTDQKHQMYFEHKIHFDSFLKKLSLPSPRSKIIHGPAKPFTPPFVIQEPSSFGSFGTFIIKSDKEWSAIRSVLSPKKIYLAREFVEGPSYGISIYIDNYRIALSAIRQQCFFKGSSVFAGVQWKRTDSFKKKTLEHLNRSLLHLACKLQDEEFFGFANIDFIITRDGSISILECNPRLSSASPHLFGVPSVMGGIPIADLYLTSGECIDPPPFFFFAIPNSTFEGSLLDVINITSENIPACSHQSGTYHAGREIELISQKLPDLSSSREVFLYYDHAPTTRRTAAGSQTGTVISNFPLFNNAGTLNDKGLAVHSYFLQMP